MSGEPQSYFATERKRVCRTLKSGAILSFSVPVDYTGEQIAAIVANFEDFERKIKSGEIKGGFPEDDTF